MIYPITPERHTMSSRLLLYGITAIVFSIAVISCNGTSILDRYIGIYNEADFQKMRDNPAGNYFLVKDITLQEVFEPIGGYAIPFTGLFDGRGKTIKNLKINKKETNYVGFFGYIESNGEVRNLKLILTPENAGSFSIIGARYVGALAGQNDGSISTVGVAGGVVQGRGNASADIDVGVGGVVGMNRGSITASNVAENTKITGMQGVGGLVGIIEEGIIKNSYSMATVVGTDGVGGLVGVMNVIKNAARANIDASYAGGTAYGDHAVGGLIGSLRTVNSNRATIKNSYTVTTVGGMHDVGGLIGKIAEETPIIPPRARANNIQIRNNYATGMVMVESSGVFGNLVGSISANVDGDVRITANYYRVVLRQGNGQTASSSRAIGHHPGTNTIVTTPFYTSGTAPNQLVYEEIGGRLIQQTDFADWNFDRTWRMQEGYWPQLSWQAP